MRTHCIAVLSTDREPSGASGHQHWWDEIFRAWPAGIALPRLESMSPEDLLASVQSGRAATHLDCVVLSLSSVASESTLYRLLDGVQQAMLPTLLLVDERMPKLDDFHAGSVLVQPLDAPAAMTAAMLHALAARQTAVRSMEQNLKLAQSFQGETAAEIDRLHQELLLAARVQRDFMPKHMPQVEGFEANVLFRPAGFVSGDTYDVSRLDETHVGFFIADAMGHGVPAALMTLYLTGSLPRKEFTQEGYRIVPPGEALTRLNNGLQECMAGPARFATAIAGVVNTETGLITIACAGHPPPLRIGPHGVKPVEVSGMLLGVVADYEYEQVTIRLEPDELLVLHSDGIETAFGPRSAATDESTAKIIPPHYRHLAIMRRGESLRDLDTAMLNLAMDIDGQAGSLHQDDDLTILAMQTRPTGTREFDPEKAAGAETFEQLRG